MRDLSPFFFSGICAISSGVVVSLLQEQYGFAYGMTGTLLSPDEHRQPAGRFLMAVLPGKLGMKPSALLLTAGYAVGYGLMGLVSGGGWALAFFLVGLAKGQRHQCLHHPGRVITRLTVPGA